MVRSFRHAARRDYVMMDYFCHIGRLRDSRDRRPITDTPTRHLLF